MEMRTVLFQDSFTSNYTPKRASVKSRRKGFVGMVSAFSITLREGLKAARYGGYWIVILQAICWWTQKANARLIQEH